MIESPITTTPGCATIVAESAGLGEGEEPEELDDVAESEELGDDAAALSTEALAVPPAEHPASTTVAAARATTAAERGDLTLETYAAKSQCPL